MRVAGSTAHPWPAKNGNFKRTGQAHWAAGPTDLSEAAWVFEHEGNTSNDLFYQSPLIDSNGNAHFSASNGMQYSVSPSGKVNWRVKLPAVRGPNGQPPTPVLHGSALYTVDGQGFLVVLSLDSGKELLRKRYALGSGADSWSMGLDEETQTVFALGFPTVDGFRACGYGGTHLYALDMHDGHIKWTYRLKKCNCNLMASAVDGQVIFSDWTGNTYALDVHTGKELWVQPGYGDKSFTTGTAAVSETGLIITAANKNQSKGVVKAFEARTGKLKWERFFAREANNAPATYRDRNGRLLVVMGIANNAGSPNPSLEGKVSFNGTVFALDAETGETVWSFSPPEWKHPACAGSTPEEMCLPDAFTNPSVDSKGTVFIGWMGGFVYAIDGTTGKGVSSWETRSGMQGAPAVGENMLVVSSCKRMAGFVAKQA